MPFGFRRRSSQQFKHIAHGLVPAATVAPRPAVPRTPPPRSPNPSPERPRSALAAAVLMTSLTGRTVAIPHPRPRSYSESDSFGVKQESFIEPYATAAELGVGDSWRDHNTERDRSLSPDFSDEDFDAEDVVEIVSDRERESAQHFSEQSNEPLSIADLYAVPNKGRKVDQMQLMESPPPLPSRPCMDSEKTPVSGSLDAIESEMSSYEVAFQTSARHEQTSVPLKELKKDSFESPRRSPRKRSPRRNTAEETKLDATDSVRQESVVHTKEMFDSLQSKIQHLETENQAMTIQRKELKKQIKELRLILNEQEDENRKLKEDGRNTQEEGEVAELHSLREQAQELVDENDALKMMVHRLNVELSCYQTKYRPLTQEEKVNIGGLPMRGPPPPWLLDRKYLSPLLLAYEDRMRDKDSIIMTHEKEMRTFRARAEEVVQENEQLHQQLEKYRPITSKEWKQLQVQAKLVLEENQVLMKQFEVQQAKAKESHNRHVQEVSKLTKQLMLLETKKQNQDEELSEIQKQFDALRFRYDELKANLDGRIAAEEHVAMVNELKSHLQEERDKRHTEVEDLMGRLSALQGEKKSLLLEKNGLGADNKTLEEELEMAQKTNRKYQKKIALLKQYLEEAMEKEVAAHQYLANLIHLAENIALERDQLVHMTKGLENEKHNVLNKVLGGNVRLGQLEEKVKVYKKKAASKIEDIHLRLMEQEEDFAGKAAQYQREMKHLQRLLLDRQETLDEVLQQKREVEGELEIVWESTSQENRRIKELLTQSLGKNKLNTSKHHAFDSDDIAQKDSVYGIVFSDCDVKLLSPKEDHSKPEHLR